MTPNRHGRRPFLGFGVAVRHRAGLAAGCLQPARFAGAVPFLMESRNGSRLLFFIVLLIGKPVPAFPEALHLRRKSHGLPFHPSTAAGQLPL